MVWVFSKVGFGKNDLREEGGEVVFMVNKLVHKFYLLLLSNSVRKWTVDIISIDLLNSQQYPENFYLRYNEENIVTCCC